VSRGAATPIAVLFAVPSLFVFLVIRFQTPKNRVKGMRLGRYSVLHTYDVGRYGGRAPRILTQVVHLDFCGTG
jgi:hypothetical protein